MVAKVNLFDLIYVAFSAQLSLIAVVMCVLHTKEGIHVADHVGMMSIISGLVFSVGIVVYFIATMRPGLVLWGPIAAVIGSAAVAVAMRPSASPPSSLIKETVT